MYLEYEQARRDHNRALKTLAELTDRKEELFARTQPGAIRYDRDMVKSTPEGNKVDDYIVASAGLDDKIEAAREIVRIRAEILDERFQALKSSRDLYDLVYFEKYVNGLRVFQIAGKYHYSESHIFRILSLIRKMIGNES